MQTIEHVIANKTTSGTSTESAPVYNPATGEIQAQVVLGTAADVDDAVQAALTAFESWSNYSLSARSTILFSFRELVAHHIDELAEIITREHGKVLSDARGEVQRGLEVVEFATGIPHLLKGDYSDQVSTDVDLFSFRSPLGVVAGITPFNFPVMVPMWMYPIAVACGNTFILKPSERDPSASMLIAKLWAEAGLPPGVFNVVHGDKRVVDALLEHRDVAAVSFVGSTPIARYVHEKASQTGKRVQALGGAKNHAVVLPDADIDFASNHLVAGAFGSAGQRCMAVSAVVAVGDAATPLLESLTAKAAAIVVGPGVDEKSEMGPVVTKAAKERITDAIASGAAQGASVVIDGRDLVVDGHGNGFFVGPTILDNVTTNMDAYREEIFGPVLEILHADTLEEAIAIINDNPYGNGTAIFTSSGDAARQFQRSVNVGMIGINVSIPVPMAYYSFGGWKDSLFGDKHVHGEEGVSFYTKAKVVTSRWPRRFEEHGASLQFPTAK